jgi:long-chain fatty acid transport protein
MSEFGRMYGVGRVARRHLLVSVSMMLGIAAPAHAGAFQNSIQSAGSASVSTAGETAIAEDAATVYYNPAGMTSLSRPEIDLAGAMVQMSSHFANGGTTDALGGAALGTSGDKGQNFPVPDFFAVMPLSPRLSLGLGLFSPFGQANNYPTGWVGRYQLQKISLKTVDIDPAIAYRLTSSFSVGGGIDIQYAHFTRSNTLDFGSLCFVSLNPTACTNMGLVPQGADGRLAVAAADWNVGFNLGVLYDPSPWTHIGLTYRSAVSHDLSGMARFQVPTAATPLLAGGMFQDTDLTAKITLPEMIAFGLSQRIDDNFTLLVDIDGTRWSHLKQLTLNFANPAQPDQGLTLNWHDSARAAVGGIYRIADDIELRGGVSYDQTPVPTAFRDADIPDSNEVMISAGLSYRFDEDVSALISYSHGEFASAPVNLAMFGAGTLAGRFQRSSDAIGLQTRIRF